ESADADVARAVLEIVLYDESDLWTDVRAGLHRVVDVGLRRVRRVLELTASGARGGAGLRAVCVHHAPQSDRFGFVAQGVQLLFGDRRPGANAFALRCEDFDEVRALRLATPNHGAQRVQWDRGVGLDR